MMSLWDALRMNMMISYQELVRTFPNIIRIGSFFCFFSTTLNNITYDSHISLFSNWKSHSLNT